jgi:hypothetical protein
VLSGKTKYPTGTDGQPAISDAINSYHQTHVNLVNAIRSGNFLLNEAQNVPEACLTAMMGWESAYIGTEVIGEEMMKSSQRPPS